MTFNQGVHIVKLPAQIVSGLHAAVATFLMLFVPTAIGFYRTVVNWFTAGHHTAFPAMSTLGYAAFAAFSAALTGLGLTVYRYAQGRWPWLPGSFPTFTNNTKG